MVALPASDHRIRRAAVAALGRRCVTAEALAVELEGAGIDLGPEGVDRLGSVLDMSSEGTVALSRRAAFRTATRQQMGDLCAPKWAVSFGSYTRSASRGPGIVSHLRPTQQCP
jgi:hypothetical protein